MSSLIITHNRSYGYFLSALLGIFSAWLVTATVDAVKQTIAIHQSPGSSGASSHSR